MSSLSTAGETAFLHIGQALARGEDARHLAGNAAFVADLDAPDCLNVAFCRSPAAHGRLRGISLPQGAAAQTFWTAADIAELADPIYCALLRPEFNGASYPLLAEGKVRFAGEPVVLVLAATRAAAEELADQVELDIEPLKAVVNAWDEVEHPGVPLHDHLDSNLVMRVQRSLGDADAIIAKPEALGLRKVTRRFAMGRVLASPLECRGCLAYVDKKNGYLVVHLSTQRPHLIRTFLAEQIPGLSESDIKVVVPDVGGGFGSKSNLYPEEILVAALAWKLGRPVRWIEDRYEHFVASNHSRQHDQQITAYFDDAGKIHAVDALVVVDAGAYSAKTSTGAIEANMATNVLLGPYDIRNYRFESVSIHTNKSPLGPYRGVGRPGACFAMERIIDEVAHALGADPLAVRRANLVSASQMPYVSITGLAYDSGNYRQVLDAAEEFVASNWQGLDDDEDHPVGVGYAMLVEQAAHGAEEWRRRGSPLIYGHESARATLNMDGSLVIEVGTLSHGQGHFTSLAQIAAEVTSLPLSAIRIRQGDTSSAPYGLGSVASRSIVMAGGAVAMACREIVRKARLVHAAVLDVAESETTLRDGSVVSAKGSMTFGELARVAYVGVNQLPRSISPGFSIQADYRPSVETGTFSYAMHATRVRVDPATGFVKILDYLVVEDCGTVVNPLILDGQIRGGVAQGIGQALYEEMVYDDNGQPRTVTFGDYVIPSAVEIPPVSILHFCTPSPHSEFGMKGMGEGGAVAPPAAIANAVRNALLGLGVEVCRTPITPDYLLRQLRESRLARGMA